MLPRYKTVALALLLWSMALSAWAGETEQPRKKNPLISFYQTVISPVDGDRCPMYPTCSRYAAQSIQKHGPVMGWIMATDRLMRCGRDEARLSPSRVVSGRVKIHDPVENNDFWWSEP